MRDANRLWLVVALLAAGFFAFVQSGRLGHLAFVGSLDPEPAAAQPHRALVVPGHSTESYRLIEAVQARSSPAGAVEGEVRAPGPMCWYLAALARIGQAIRHLEPNASVEWAAVWAEPLLHGGLLLLVAAIGVWQFGPGIAALLTLGAAALFPFAGGFVAGAPAPATFTLVGSVLALLGLFAGFRHLAEPARESWAPLAWFVVAGVGVGLATWSEAFYQCIFAAGLVVGGGALAALGGLPAGVGARAATCWRGWGLAAALTMLLGWLADASPAGLTAWQLDAVHPLHALSILGVAELLARLGRRAPGVPFGARACLGVAIAAVIAGAAVWVALATPATLLPHARELRQLTRLPAGAVAENFGAWARDHDVQFWATLLPLLAAIPAWRWMMGGRIDPVRRAFLLLATGLLAATIASGLFHLRHWHWVDATLLGLLAGGAARFGAEASAGRAGWLMLGLFPLLLPGIARLVPPPSSALPVQEINAMLERDLARWLARRAGPTPAVVWAPPDTTVALGYYGGLRGVGTLAAGDEENLLASVRVARAASAPEALALLQRRGVTHLVLPNWDPYLDDVVAQAGGTQGNFLGVVRGGELPRWLRPVPYQFRPVAGLEEYGVVVCEVVDEQEENVALAQRAEYYAEMGRREAALAAAQALRRFPTEVSALTARVQVYAAAGDDAQRARAFGDLRKRLDAGGDRYLSWDRRVSLALVLARENELVRAVEQARRCAQEATPERLRALSPGTLLNFQLLLKALDLSFEDPALAALARELLPHELREHL